MILPAAFLALVACAILSHWAVWRRLGECEGRCKALATRVELQAKQIAGLQAWCINIDREVEINMAKQIETKDA